MKIENTTRRQALIALALVLLPNLALTGLGLLMRRPAQQVADSQAVIAFGPARFLRQIGLQLFFLLPMGLWLGRRGAGWSACGWRRRRLGGAVTLGMLMGATALLVRARPFAPERLRLDDTWWALATYAVVALAEEMLYRGFLQGTLADSLGRWTAYVVTALLFTALHLPARLLGGEPLARSLTYAAVRLLPMALIFGATMLAADHVAAPTLVHLAWNWATVFRQGRWANRV